MGMRFFRPATDAGSQAAVAEGYHGGRLATLLAAVALLVSGLSYYARAPVFAANIGRRAAILGRSTTGNVNN